MAASFKTWMEYKGRHSDKLQFNWQRIIDASKQPFGAVRVVDGNHIAVEWTDHYYGLIFQFEREILSLKTCYDEYFSITGLIDYAYFDSLKDEFLKYFPKKDRYKTIRYFDTMVDELIQIYESMQGEKPENRNPENPHPEIFVNAKAWQMFNEWKNNASYPMADLCFIYWKMQQHPRLMRELTPGQFKNWIFEKCGFDFGDYWKQLYRVATDERIKRYSRHLQEYQPHK